METTSKKLKNWITKYFNKKLYNKNKRSELGIEYIIPGIETYWDTYAICKGCLERYATPSFNDIWFSRNKTCGFCGDVGNWYIITTKQEGYEQLCKIVGKIYKIKTKQDMIDLLHE